MSSIHGDWATRFSTRTARGGRLTRRSAKRLIARAFEQRQRRTPPPTPQHGQTFPASFAGMPRGRSRSRNMSRSRSRSTHSSSRATTVGRSFGRSYRARRFGSSKRAAWVETKHKELDASTLGSGLISWTGLQAVTDSTADPPTFSAKVTNYVNVPTTWKTMTRGVDPDQIVGQDIFAKWLNVKLAINYNLMDHISVPSRIRLLWGWCKITPGQYETPLSDHSNTDYEAGVRTVLAQVFDKPLNHNDKTQLQLLGDEIITKQGANIINENSSGSQNEQEVIRSQVERHLKWSPMRKIRYNEPELEDHAGEKVPSTTVFLPEVAGGLWVPFYCLWDQTELFCDSSTGSTSYGNATTHRPRYCFREDFYYTDA